MPIQNQMEKILDYFKNSLKIAWKSIFFNFKQYIYFFVAILIIQVFCGVMTLSMTKNNAIERESVSDAYDYHLLVSNLNEDQKVQVQTNGGAAFTNDIYFEVVKNEDGTLRVSEYKNSYGDKRYDVYLWLKGDIKESLARFRTEYVEDTERGLPALQDATGDPFYCYESPLMDVETHVLENNAAFWAILAVLFALSIFLMMMLYNIRVNQYKFQYGVYMTYGADFKMLFNTAFWEMALITVLTLIPSVIISWVVVSVMYGSIGDSLSAYVLLVFPFSLLAVTIAVFFPMRVMSVRMPMTLIVTEDNSNLVSSPSSSTNVFKKKFPTFYETLSSWRFRKYSVKLLLTAIVFCAIFIMGLYLSNIYVTDLDYNRPEFKIDLSNSHIDYDAEMGTELRAIKGIRTVEISRGEDRKSSLEQSLDMNDTGNESMNNSMEAKDISSHILVESSNVKALKSGVTNYSGTQFQGDSSMKMSNQVTYIGINAEQVQVIEDLGYTYEGKLEDVTKPGYVILGDSLSNITTFKYEVGDKIWIAVKTGGSIKAENLSGNQLLRAEVEGYKFDYKEFTIAAILTDIPSGNLPIYLNTEDYKAVTGRDFTPVQLNIYVDPDLTPDSVAELEASVRQWGRGYDNVNIEATNNLTTRVISYEKHRSELYIVISIMLLVISPIMWFFSQTLYYLKREQEFNILQALGARVSDIRNIYLQGGLQMAGLSLIISIILSYLGSYILFYVFNVLIPKLSGEFVRYTFYMPWYAILTSVVVSVACGFLSAYLPYKSYYKHRFTLENGGAGSGED